MCAARTAPSGPGAGPRLWRALRLSRLGRSSSLVLAGALLVGCGSSRSSLSAVCRPAVRVLAGASWLAATGNNGEPECRLSAGRLRAVVNLDASPQPYARLEREIVEDGQSFGTVRSFAPPQAVGGVGLDAAWLPDLDQLISADHRVLVTVTLNRRGLPGAGERTLAVQLARAYLSAGT